MTTFDSVESGRGKALVAWVRGVGRRGRVQWQQGRPRADGSEPEGNRVQRAPPPGMPTPPPKRTSPLDCPMAQQQCATNFSIPAGTETTMEVRGSWAPDSWVLGAPMTKTGKNWTASVPLPVGQVVQYKYCANPQDGSCNPWETDPSMPTVPPDGNHQIGPVACDAPTCAPPPSAALRFIAVGDTGKGNGSETQVAMAMDAKCRASGCDFVLLLGDNIYDTGASSPTDPQFASKFETPFTPLDMPFYVALGNHDYGGGGMGNEFDKPDNEIAYSQHSTKWKMPARYYHFTEKSTDFFALDTNAQMYSMDGQQKTDVSGWLAASTATWKIVYGHHPYMSNGPHGNAGIYDGAPQTPVFNGVEVKAFSESVWCGKADLYLSGHDHTRQWLTDTCSGTELVVSGGGSSPDPLVGSNATRFAAADLGFLYVVVDGSTLLAEFCDSSGNVNFARKLTK